MIRPMYESDLDAVVDVHMKSFPRFFLTSLGKKFIALFYQGICADPQGIAFVCTDQADEPFGFVAGSANPRGFYSRLLKRDWFRFVYAAVGPMIRRPSVAVRIARAFYHPASNPVGNDVAGLFSIALLPKSQGKGGGKKLVEVFLVEAEKLGCKKVFLTTDRDGNEPVNAFYQSIGFELKRQYMTKEGRWMNEYWTGIPENQATESCYD